MALGSGDPKYNPLVYSDPTGEWFWIPAVIIGAYIGGTTANDGEFNPGKWDYSDPATYGGMVIGGVAGYAGAAVGAAAGASAMAGGATAVEAGIAGGMMGGMTQGAINSAGMTALAGGSFSDVMAGMTQGAVVGGFVGAAGAAAFQGTNNLLNKSIPFAGGSLQPFKLLPANTLSYMAGSTASQMTANIVNGRNPFKGIDYGFNLGLLYPLSIDVMRYSKHYNMHLARKHMPNEEIVSAHAETNIMPNGDLSFDQSIGVQGYYGDFKMEIGHLDLTGLPNPVLYYHDLQHTISGYQWHIFSIYQTLSLKRR
ncbi:MAG: hypothetical protein K9H58_18635 [Bacteroidales bacterium]|nr:hypothetical protein [Bacteroidales bacterium]